MDKYIKILKIGEGAFGKADLVKRKQDSLQLVIKEINISRMSQKERDEARKEVAVLAQLNHPNIVAYRESFEEHGNLYIVMDFCAGGDLYAKINSQRGVLFTEDQILDWFVQMCLAVKHIHDRKILHRDIKSQNIFLNSKGMVQLGDFGIAKVLNSTVELARTCIGTPYYLSPEICESQPYNNKSDVWSLGCVLYEVATLKHAFEAGNMKNLVLKIIRGSYPPLSSKYSYELRNLVAQLFKRSPRDRPSVNTVLKKPFISQRIARFLTSEQLDSEFSHTIMHGHKPARALPPPPKEALRPPSARNRPDSDGPAEVKKYDPSKIYGAPVVRKSKENRASAGDLKKRPGSAGSRPASASGSRPGSAAGSRPSSSQLEKKQQKEPIPISPSYKDLLKKKQELMEKEKKRQDERKKADELKKKEFERKHKELQEKQKISRINKAREEGWSSLINSLESNKSGKAVPLIKKEEAKAAQAEGHTPFIRAPAGPSGDYNAHAAAARGRYDYYNEYLDKLQRDREVRQKQDAAPVKANMGAPVPRPLPGAPKPSPIWRQAPKAPEPSYQPCNQRAQNQQEERAKLVNDFISRRKEAESNKHRGQAELFGPFSSSQEKRKPSSLGPNGSNQQRPPPSAVSNRNKEEQEYLEKLRQIRQQNYNERRGLQAKLAAGMDQNSAAVERKKTADALKKQAEDWAKVKRDHLEQKQQELMDEDQLRRENRQIMNRPSPVPGFKPSPAVPMTNVMNAIGGTPRMVPAAAPAAQGPAMTNILGDIGVTPRMVEEARTKTPVQQQRYEILQKLNQQGPPKDFEEPQESPRPKWGAKCEEIKFAENHDYELVRPRWGGPPALNLGKMPLEETASQMDATSARDRVILNPDSVRRQWSKPGETVINALQGVPLAEQTMGSNKSDNSGGSSASTVDSPAITRAGSTIVVSKNPISQGTITIIAHDDNNSQVKESTITTSKAPEDVVQTEITSVANANTVPAKVVIRNQDIQFPVMEVEEASPDIVKQLETVQKSVNQSETVQKSVNQSETVQKSVGQSETVHESGQSEICSSNKPPPIPTRKLQLADDLPPVPSKPLVFPKPVLLPQPDSPMQFGLTGIYVRAALCIPAAASNCPVSVRSEGPGALFERVELNEYDKEEDQKHLDKANPGYEAVMKEHFQEIDKHQSGLVMGITMGSFDIGHRELLRTCSEPDLACLYRTMNDDTSSKVRVKSLEEIAAETEELEENTDSMVVNVDKAIEAADNIQDVDHGEDKLEDMEDDKADIVDDEDDEDSELADLLSVRETMRSLLLREFDEDKKSKSPVKFSLSSSMEPETDTNDGDVEDTEDDDKQDSYDDDDKDGQNNEDNNEDNDEDDVEEHNDSDDGIDAPDVGKSLSVDNENPQTPDDVHTESTSEFSHSDESDSDFNDGADMADFDLFGRLEESRAQLEHELGADKLKLVYRTIQDCQEDEEGNIEEGARIAQQMLGEDKVHLYPKIFQLVMADSAFTDDNFS